ncbi:MAG: hypothetical protein AAFR31_16195 [Cyanobacteria bacterium J06627_8]
MTYPTQDALQWWHQQQVNRLHDGAELIRDGILQELFAIRRELELTYDNQASVSHDQIRQLEELHHQLEAFSNQLSPAFSRDSLPLAFQHVIQQWTQQHPNHTVLTQLPKTLHPIGAKGQIAVTVLEELFLFFSNHLTEEASINVELIHTEDSVTLGVGLCSSAFHQCKAIARLREVAYLQQSFEFLTQGHAVQSVASSKIDWQFTWQSEP